MKRALLLILLVIATVAASTQPESIGVIERLRPEFDLLVPKSAIIEKLAEGFDWSEGPVWISARKCLLFSDVPLNAIFRWDEHDGLTQFLKPSGYDGPGSQGGYIGSNGLSVDNLGRLVICQQGNRRLVRVESDGTITVIADRFLGKRLNSPNDLVFRSTGDLYFTDPPYGLIGRDADPAKELNFNGVFRVSPEGNVELLTTALAHPNGIAFSPDERTLYVSNSDASQAIWMAFTVLPDGKLADGRVFHDATGLPAHYRGVPDGIKVDRHGNLFTAGPGGINVFSPDARLLGRINPGETANCAWGSDGSTLYITADGVLCRIRTSTIGLGFWPQRARAGRLLSHRGRRSERLRTLGMFTP